MRNHVAIVGDKRNAYWVFGGGSPDGRRSLGSPGRRWEDNVKMVPKEVG